MNIDLTAIITATIPVLIALVTGWYAWSLGQKKATGNLQSALNEQTRILLDALRKERDELKSERQDLINEIKTLQEANVALREEMHLLRTEIAVMRSSIATIGGRVTDVEDEQAQ